MDSCNDTLFLIDSELTQEDLDSLKFLCSDLLPNKRLLAIKSNLDLFGELQKQELIEEGKYDFLAELLYIIGQHSLLKNLGTSKPAVQEALKKKRTVSSYRHMLFQLYEDITSEDLRSIRFLLSIPKKYEENKMTFLDILYYLEKNDQLSEDNLDTLEKAVSRVSLELLKKIYDYKQTRVIEIKARSQSLSSEYDDKMQFSIQAQGYPDDDRRKSIGEIVQHVSERDSEKDLMDENTENRMSDLSLNGESDQEVTQTHDVLTYPMNRKHRGYCLIINNSEFMKSPGRPGTEKDAEYLTAVFTWLGLDVEICSELSTQEIHDCLKEFSKRDHTERDCFICCILTHGESQAVYGTDNEMIYIREVTSYFSIGNCSTLAGKPKLFFIQACQGKRPQGSHSIEADAVSAVEERKVTITVPTDADLLVGMSTVDGYYSFRHPRKGTWYIQALCANLTKMVPKGEDILSILTKVNKDVSEMEYFKDGRTNMKQMPQPTYTLRQKLVFPKPLAPFKPPFQEKN
ncbi:caspase-8-like [Bufo gargarizans]|uniref:caspase-8-like n=1 Tax=Bufo gargarizans TaxID=30331 RepID=UPI001CF12015|nr:caspase-8-like [Bufo gargarizans]